MIVNKDTGANCRFAPNRGFTLVEILLAMLITSILVLGIRGMYHQAHVLWSEVEDTRPIYHAARIITETLRQEVSGLYFPPVEEDNSEPVFSLTYLPTGQIDLLFYTLTPSWKSGIELSRMAKVRYAFTKDESTGEAILYRTEQLCASEKLLGGENTEVILTGISDFYVWADNPNPNTSGDLWMQSYDSKDKPPKAIKILIRWKGTRNSDLSGFEASFPILCQGPIQPQESGT